MFDAITNFIKYLESSLQHTNDPKEIAEIKSLIEKAKRIKYRTHRVPA